MSRVLLERSMMIVPSSCLTIAAWGRRPAGDRVPAEQRLVALQTWPFLSFSPRRRAPSICCKGDLERTRIDGGEQLPLLHSSALREQHLRDHARDLRPDGGGDHRQHRAERIEHHRQVGARRGGDADRAGRARPPRPSTASRPAALRRPPNPTRPRRRPAACRRPTFRRAMREVPGERGERDQGGDGDHAAAPARRRRRGRAAEQAAARREIGRSGWPCGAKRWGREG